VSTSEHPEESTVRVSRPEETLRNARPLPSREEMVVKGVSHEEWEKFRAALREA